MRPSVTAVAIACAGTLLAAQDEPRYRASTDLVPVYATVVDANGRHVSNLPETAFSVFDNGQARPITSFGSGLQNFSVVVMLDFSGSVERYRDAMKDATLAFIERLDANDRARIGTFSTDVVIRPDGFTGDRTSLSAAVRNDDGSLGGSPVWAAVGRSIETVATQSGRRVVVFVSDGRSNEHPREVQKVIDRAVASDVMVYTVGLTGQETSMGPSYPTMPEVPRFPIPGRDGRQLPTPRLPPKPKSNPPSPLLERAATETGGAYFGLKGGQDMRGIFVNVADELHHQYLLGFRPEVLDGLTHRITVRVNRSGLRVRARQSYIADLAK